MKNTKLTNISALLLSALLPIGASNAQEQGSAFSGSQSGDIQKFSEIPGTGMKMLETGSGVFFVSPNGRYALKGKLYDNWTNKWLPDVASLELSTKFSLSEVGVDMDSLSALSAGNGDKQVDVFVDPRCPYCKQLVNKLVDYMDDYTFNFILIPVISKESTRDVATLWCASDSGLALKAMADGAWKGIPQRDDCDLTPITNARMLANMVGVGSVPYLINQNGEHSVGSPPDLATFLDIKQDKEEKSIEQFVGGDKE